MQDYAGANLLPMLAQEIKKLVEEEKAPPNSLGLWPRALSPRQAWEYIGVKKARFYQLVHDGIIRIHKLGAKSIVYREDLDALLDGVKNGTIVVAPKCQTATTSAPNGSEATS